LEAWMPGAGKGSDLEPRLGSFTMAWMVHRLFRWRAWLAATTGGEHERHGRRALHPPCTQTWWPILSYTELVTERPLLCCCLLLRVFVASMSFRRLSQSLVNHQTACCVLCPIPALKQPASAAEMSERAVGAPLLTAPDRVRLDFRASPPTKQTRSHSQT
jgi:hypothetical protein